MTTISQSRKDMPIDYDRYFGKPRELRIYIVGGILAFSTLLLIYFLQGSNKFSNDLMLNLASETIGIIVTVVFIERIIRQREKKRYGRMAEILSNIVKQRVENMLSEWEKWFIEFNKSRPERTSKKVTRPRRRSAVTRYLGKAHEDYVSKILLGTDEAQEERNAKKLGKPLGTALLNYSNNLYSTYEIQAISPPLYDHLRSRKIPPELTRALFVRLDDEVKVMRDWVDRYQNLLSIQMLLPILEQSEEIMNFRQSTNIISSDERTINSMLHTLILLLILKKQLNDLGRKEAHTKLPRRSSVIGVMSAISFFIEENMRSIVLISSLIIGIFSGLTGGSIFKSLDDFIINALNNILGGALNNILSGFVINFLHGTINFFITAAIILGIAWLYIIIVDTIEYRL